jgi:hypothetical protein
VGEHGRRYGLLLGTAVQSAVALLSGVVGGAAGFWSMGTRYRSTGYLWRAERYALSGGGLAFAAQILDCATVLVCGFTLFARIGWLTVGLIGRLFGIELPHSHLCKADWLLLGAAALLFANAIRLANTGPCGVPCRPWSWFD